VFLQNILYLGGAYVEAPSYDDILLPVEEGYCILVYYLEQVSCMEEAFIVEGSSS